MFTYSMMPLDTDHLDELVADIKDQHKRGISTCPMFIMTLVPEGTPVWDKVGPMCERFRKFKEALAPDGIPIGILRKTASKQRKTIRPALRNTIIRGMNSAII